MLDINTPSSLLDVSVENDMGVLVMYQSIRRWVTVSLPKDLNLPQFRDKKITKFLGLLGLKGLFHRPRPSVKPPDT